MNEHATKMLQTESAYLAAVERNLDEAKGKQLEGSIWQTARLDDSDRLRALMAEARVYDRGKLKTLPHNRRVVMHGFRRNWFFGKKKTGVAVASVLCPLEALVTDLTGTPPPIDLPELHDHVRKLVSDPSVEHLIGVCAPSGFTEAARQAVVELPNVRLVLSEPAPGGGWNVHSPDQELPESVKVLFDPEEDTDKYDRVLKEIEDRSADLLTGGLSASSMAERLELPKDMVIRAIERAAAKTPELHVSRKSGDLLLYRGASAKPVESFSMSVVDKIRKLFSNDGDENEKINLLSERRARLSQRRDQLYEDIGKLETKEADLLAQGKANKSQVTRRRLAAQLGQLRKDIGRQNTTANMLNQQINIISTDIHNLTLIQQGSVAQLPSSEELTENAVKAEEMLETLQVDAEMVSSLETGLSDISTSDDELAILQEFDEGEPVAEKPAPRESSAPPIEKVNEEPPPQTEEPQRRADPEAT